MIDRPTSIHLRLTNIAGGCGYRKGEPVTVGIPLPRGLARTPCRWAVATEDDRLLPAQVRVLDRWSDGSIRWALLDFRADSAPAATTRARLLLDAASVSTEPALSVRSHGSIVEIDTGRARFRLSDAAPLLFEEVSVGQRSIVNGPATQLRVIIEGRVCTVRWQTPVIEEQGPLRLCVRAEAVVQRGRQPTLCLVMRLHFYAGSGVVRTLLTVRNPRRAAHAGGIWELGDAGSVLLDDLSVVIRRTTDYAAERIRFSPELGQPLLDAAEHVEIYQESSGGDNWNSSNHVNRHGTVPLRWNGYRVERDAVVWNGRRATPSVSVEGGGCAIGAALPHFWQNFPRALAATRDEVIIGLFPAQFGDCHELQGGEQKTHEWFVLFGDDPVTDIPLEWCRSRLIAAATPEWYTAAEAAPYITPAGDSHPDYLSLVSAAIEGSDTFFDKRERVDEYGWRHFGDIYGDHEAALHHGPAPLVSHYNNQYDAVAGFAYQFMRTGDPRWWTQCLELAAHVVDIDTYHTDADKSGYNHGLFWHTVHYVDAGKSTHRTYPRAKGSNGGGPASEHNYTMGLMLHYFMTGDASTRDAALELAQFVIDIDDGAKTPFAWLAPGHTGLASASRTPGYHGPGRGSGNSLNALLDGHRLSGNRLFLDKAEQLIRRCVHPHQSLEPLQLLDRENRWFYTMFLQSLGKYLDYKIELGELDEMYAYAQGTLLHYARWMAVNEYPYLDKPEELDYPTETWAAQDLRKVDVFNYAAKHADASERSQFRERAGFFFRYSTSTLKTLGTRTLARPVVLLLTHGWMQAAFEQQPNRTAPGACERANNPVDRPKPFVSQKVRAKQRALLLIGVSTGGCALAIMTRLLVGMLN